MWTRFFINRPIFSSVIAIIIVLAGAISIPLLPIAEYPQIVPPTIQVTATYQGANAQTVAETVTTPIEEEINGVEGMISIASVSTDNGSSVITVTFDVGYDIDIAAINVQNRVSLAQPKLPQQVVNNGIKISKQSTDMVMVVTMMSPDQSRSLEFMSNYASINLVDPLQRVPGVGGVAIFGERTYAMRFWLDTQTMAGYQLTATDVSNAIKEQNTIAPVGAIGSAPSRSDQVLTYVLEAEGRLDTLEAFENIVVRVNNDGSLLYVKDIARVELGAANYLSSNKVDAQPTIALAIYQLPNANALSVARKVKAELVELADNFPVGVEYRIPFDTTAFVREAVAEVVWTLSIALLLVVLVVFVFLQHWRATLIPIVVIPISLVGTFSLIAALGFSINLLTLFGLVLAIGLVVDDAIVVVENISRLIKEDGMPAKDAAIESMREVFGPVTASTLVMMVVFIPASFIPGITGQLYQQFALTIACSLGLSWIMAMTFTPAFAALLLQRDVDEMHGLAKYPHDSTRLVKLNKISHKLSAYFNRSFERSKLFYTEVVDGALKHRKAIMLSFWAIVVVTVFLFFWVPSGFVPQDDQGYIIVSVQLPTGSAIERTEHIMDEAGIIIAKTKGVQNTVAVSGFDLFSGTIVSNFGAFFVILDPYDERGKQESADAIIDTLRQQLFTIEEAFFIPLNPPPIAGLSATGGFDFVVEDRIGAGEEALYGATWAMIGVAKERVPLLGPLFSTFQVDAPRLYLDIDRDKTMTYGLSVQSIYNELQANLGGLYVNDFNKFGQTYRVYIQAQPDQRARIEDIDQIYVRNSLGEMIPMSALLTIERRSAANIVTRYNLFNATHIMGSPAPGHSSGEALFAMKALAKRVLPKGFDYEWTGSAYQEEKSGHVAPLVFLLSLLIVFLVIAALYESWVLPGAILMAVPLAMFGALGSQWLRGLANDVYCQIALIMLIGLAAKNAILIVQFANDKRLTGADIHDSIIYACQTRLRPILMTALAFILGVTPLVFASGAGAASRHSLGTAVFGGMVVSTFLSLVFVPVIYYVFQTWREKWMHVSRISQSSE